MKKGTQDYIHQIRVSIPNSMWPKLEEYMKENMFPTAPHAIQNILRERFTEESKDGKA